MMQQAMRQSLEGTKQRVTSQRVLLLELIREAGGHLDADELYRRARGRSPRVSLSTVYRTLRLFKQLGLVQELHFDEEHHHYEQRAPKEHQHLTCLRCGKVTEFTSPLIARLKTEVERREGFQVQGTEIHLSGLCSACQGKK